MMWNERDGQPRTNLVSWQDTRCVDLVDETNSCYTTKAINLVGTSPSSNSFGGGGFHPKDTSPDI